MVRLFFAFFVTLLFLPIVPTHASGPEFIELMKAISNSDLPKVQQILDDPEKRKEIHFQERSISGNTPLTLAAFKGNTDIVRMILEYAPDHPDSQKMADGSTALMIAASWGSIDIVKLLLLKGADPNLRRGANPKLHRRSGSRTSKRANFVTPFFLAAQEGHQEVIEEFLKLDHFNYKKEIQSAISLGRQDFAHDLLQIYMTSNRGVKSSENTSMNTLLGSLTTLFDSECSICKEVAGTTSGKKRLDGKERHGVPQVTPCGHCFCEFCLDGHFSTVAARGAIPRCPICRGEFKRDLVLSVREEAAKVSHVNKVTAPGRDESAPILRVESNDPRVAPIQLNRIPEPQPRRGLLNRLAARFNRTRQSPPRITFIQLGNMYEVAGLIWSGVATQKMDQSDAERFCRDLGDASRLPTREEYEALGAAMNVEGRYDSNSLPGIARKWFWSSSVHPQSPEYAYAFGGSRGHFGMVNRIRQRSVRCVIDI